MPHGSFTKLSLPPRISDLSLEPLSIVDHTKYLSHYARCQRLLRQLQQRGGSRQALIDFGKAADWLRAVDTFFRQWSREWAFAYIHHTYPAGDWPGCAADLYTLDPLTFAFLWYCDARGRDLCRFQLQVSGTQICGFCRRALSTTGLIFRFGVPACGMCSRKLLKPLSAGLICSEDFDSGTLIFRFQGLLASQRFIDLQPVISDPYESGFDFVFSFMGSRCGLAESQTFAAVQSDLPVFILEMRNGLHVGEND